MRRDQNYDAGDRPVREGLTVSAEIADLTMAVVLLAGLVLAAAFLGEGERKKPMCPSDTGCKGGK